MACGSNAAKGHRDAGEVFESDPGNPLLDPPRPPDYLNDDSGAFGPPAERQNDAGVTAPEGGRVSIDAGTPQTGLDAKARRKNLRGAFALAPNAGLPAHVVLFDDVMTTGTTLREAARVLRRAGVARVDVWALARAPARG